MITQELEHALLNALIQEGRPEAMINAMHAVAPNENYEAVFEAVIAMQNKDYIKVVYCTHPHIINIQLTRVGEVAFQNTKHP